MRTMIVLAMAAALLLSGCGKDQGAADPTPDSRPNPSPASVTEQPAGEVASEAKQGDFALRLVASDSVYAADEAVELKAQLTYTGEASEVEISHAASPFYFLITETTRGIRIPYAMNEPLLHTELKQGEWFEERYVKNGGYDEQDPNKAFIRSFLEGEAFPVGQYEVYLRADFNAGDSKMTIETEPIAFTVANES